MGEDRPVDLPESSAPPGSEAGDAAPAVPCRHLRNKGMFVYNGGAYGDPGDDHENTIYWCVKTMKGYGPDDEMASRDDCICPERTCYEPF